MGDTWGLVWTQPVALALHPVPMKLLQRSSADDYQPLPRRRRLLLLALAVATASSVLWLMLQPQLRKMNAQAAQRAASSPGACGPSQTEGCVGGTMGVIVAPAPQPAPGASAAAR